MNDVQAAHERVRELRKLHGSHDKFAAELRHRTGRGTTRQTVIGWEKPGRFPDEGYAEALAAISAEHGIDATASDFQRSSASADRIIDERLTGIEESLARLVDLRSGAAVRLEEIEIRVARQLVAQSALLEELAEVTARLKGMLPPAVGDGR